MGKKKRTKEIEYAVKYLHEVKKIDAGAISLELGVAQVVVDGILAESDVKPEPRKSKSQNLMIRHTSSKKVNNVSIMTEAASTLNDELSKQHKNKKSSAKENCIYRPNG